jgi:hypothetical protein
MVNSFEKREGVFRRKRVIKTVHPNDSILLGKLNTLELVNLAENIDMVLTNRVCPEVVSVLAGEKGFRIVANAFEGCYKTEELCKYLVDKLGSIAGRFTVVNQIAGVKIYKVKILMLLDDDTWIEDGIILPEYKCDYPPNMAFSEYRLDERTLICTTRSVPFSIAACANLVFQKHPRAVSFKLEW